VLAAVVALTVAVCGAVVLHAGPGGGRAGGASAPSGVAGPATSGAILGPGPAVEVALTADDAVPAALRHDLSGEVTAAARRVTTIWPGPWSARVDVRVVLDAARLRAEAGWARGGPEGTVAAVAVVPVGERGSASRPVAAAPATAPAPATATATATASATGGVAGGDGSADSGARVAAGAVGGVSAPGRLVVDADVYGRLTAAGRQIVLRHELTHLATAAVTPAAMPVWLVEGFAEAVGHDGLVAEGVPAGADAAPGVGLTVPRAAAELATEVRAGRVPTHLPTDPDFDGADGRLPQTYQESWLACRFIADQVGMAGLTGLYRAVAARVAAGDSATVDELVASTVGLSPPAFLAAWRSYLRTLLAT
jgi:hypothetical protein